MKDKMFPCRSFYGVIRLRAGFRRPSIKTFLKTRNSLYFYSLRPISLARFSECLSCSGAILLFDGLRWFMDVRMMLCILRVFDGLV